MASFFKIIINGFEWFKSLSIMTYVYIGLFIVIGVYISFLKISINNLNNDIENYKKKIYTFENTVKQAEIKEIEKIVYVDREVKIIEEKKVDKIKYIKEYIYEDNKTKCDNGINIIRRGGF